MKQKTIHLFCDFLLEISSLEQKVESSRQMLSSLSDFEPYSVFQRLLNTSDNTINATDISIFLAQNGLDYSEVSTILFIRHYDNDYDDKLSYLDFLRALLPMKNPVLRTIISQRPTYEVKKLRKLDFEIEFGVSRLIEREITGQISIKAFQKDFIYNLYDFDLKEIFFSIDEMGKGYLDADDLKYFFEKNGFPVNKDQVISIIKRLDRDNDGKIGFEEFKFAIYDNDIVLSRKNEINLDNFGNKSVKKTNKINNDSNSKIKNDKKNNENMEKKQICCRKHAKKGGRNNDWIEEQGELARTLKQFILLDKEVELKKRELAYNEDFKPGEIWKLIDYKRKCNVSGYEFEEMMNKFGIFPNKHELFLFFKRFDRDYDGKLIFEDFLECTVPEDLLKIVARRNYCEDDEIDLENVLIKFS